MTDDRAGRCPDDGYCHGSSIAAGSAPCPEGNCYRVRTSGPLSGSFPGDRWPVEVLAANGVAPPARAFPRVPLSDAVRQWAEVNGGELNRLQVRELLRELDRLEAGLRVLIGEDRRRES